MYQTPRLTLLTPSSPVDQEEAIDTAERRVISQMKRFAPDSGEQFEEWLMYVNSLFALENISPVKRLRILRTFVCQAHRVVIDSNGQNYEAAIEALLIYESMGGNDPTGALLELNFAKQDQGESILEFYYRVERLVAIAYPFARYSLEERQSQALQRLVVGLRPGKVATLLTERFVSGTLALEDVGHHSQMSSCVCIATNSDGKRREPVHVGPQSKCQCGIKVNKGFHGNYRPVLCGR